MKSIAESFEGYFDYDDFEEESSCKNRASTIQCLPLISKIGGVVIRSPLSDALCLGPMCGQLVIDGSPLDVVSCTAEVKPGESVLGTQTRFNPLEITLHQEFGLADEGPIRVHSELVNESGKPIVLNSVRLMATASETGGRISLSRDLGSTRIYEQDNYNVRIRRMGEGGTEEEPSRYESSLCWLCYDADSRTAFCVGFETEERWRGWVRTIEPPEAQPISWMIGFDGGDLLVDDGERISLEDFLLLAGKEPLRILEGYADCVGRRHKVRILPSSPVSWCSWYPYRLGVTEERVLANAAIAAERLRDLGLNIIEVDLGWEKDKLPSTFEENEQFPHGLGWLAKRLDEMGPREVRSPGGYVHPGDNQVLIVTRDRELLEVSFFGPSVKLLVVRPKREHPWILGTSFHQSGGLELQNVNWDPKGILSGVLERPPGMDGYLTIAGCNAVLMRAKVCGRLVKLRSASSGALVLPITTVDYQTEWKVFFDPKTFPLDDMKPSP